MSEPIDLSKITAAVREYNAASNSMMRAHAELMSLIPPGVTVLHHTPGDPTPYYWSYESGKCVGRDGLHLFEGAGDREKYDRECVIIEAPARREEFLPRLEPTP